MTVLNHRSPSSLFFDCTDSDSLTNLSEGVGGENKGEEKLTFTERERESNSHLETFFFFFAQPSPRYNPRLSIQSLERNTLNGRDVYTSIYYFLCLPLFIYEIIYHRFTDSTAALRRPFCRTQHERPANSPAPVRTINFNVIRPDVGAGVKKDRITCYWKKEVFFGS